MYQVFFGLPVFFCTRAFVRFVRDGQRKNKNKDKDDNCQRMPKMWKSVLRSIQEIGDRSGCHQLPERSFKINSYTLPVCARCTGVFIGQLMAVALFLFGIQCPWLLAVFLLALMGFDWMLQHLGIKQSTNFRRLFTGICGGFGLFSIYIFVLVFIYNSIKLII